VMTKASIGPDREVLLRGALLTVAIGALEVLVAAAATGFYRSKPSALGDERKFSLKDLEALDSIDEARDEAIASRTENLVHGDLADWAQWFEKHPKILLENLALNYSTLFEVFQRRHIIVHNGGNVSRLYIKRMSQFGVDAPPLGRALPVDAAYLTRAFAEVEVLGNLIAIGTWAKAWPEEEPAAATN
jgi:hypothetical protein